MSCSFTQPFHQCQEVLLFGAVGAGGPRLLKLHEGDKSGGSSQARRKAWPGVPGSGRVKSLGPKRRIEKGERGRETKVNSLGMRGKWIFQLCSLFLFMVRGLQSFFHATINFTYVTSHPLAELNMKK